MRLQSIPSKFASLTNTDFIKPENAAELKVDREVGVEIFVDNSNSQVSNFIDTLKSKISSASFQQTCPSTFTEAAFEQTVSMGVSVGSMVPTRVFAAADEADLQEKLRELELNVSKALDARSKPLTVTKVVFQDVTEDKDKTKAKVTLKLHAILTHPLITEFKRVMASTYSDLTDYPLSLELGTFQLKPSFIKLVTASSHYRSVKSYLQNVCKSVFNPTKPHEIIDPGLKFILTFKSPYKTIEFNQNKIGDRFTFTLTDDSIAAGTTYIAGTKEDVALQLLSEQLRFGLGSIIRCCHWANLIGRLKVNPCKLVDLLDDKGVLERIDRDRFSSYFVEADWRKGVARLKPETEDAIDQFEQKDDGAHSLLNATRATITPAMYSDEDEEGDGGAARHGTLSTSGFPPNSSIVSQIMADVTGYVTGHGSGEETTEGNARPSSVRCGVRNGSNGSIILSTSILDYSPRCVDNLFSPDLETGMQSVASGYNEEVEQTESEIVVNELIDEVLTKVDDKEKSPPPERMIESPAACSSEWRENPLIPNTPAVRRYQGFNSTLDHHFNATEVGSDNSDRSTISSLDSFTEIEPLEKQIIDALCHKAEGMGFINRDAWNGIAKVLENYQERKHRHKISCPCYECNSESLAKRIENLKKTDVYETLILNEGEKNEKAIRVVSKQYTNGLDAIIIEQLHNMYRREISKHSAQRNTDFIFALKIVMQSWGHCFEQLQEIDVLKELCVSQAKEKVTGAEMDEAKLRIESLEKQKAVVAKMMYSHSRLRKAGPAAQQDYLKKVDEIAKKLVEIDGAIFKEVMESIIVKDSDDLQENVFSRENKLSRQITELNNQKHDLKAEITALRTATEDYAIVEEEKLKFQRRAENSERRVKELLEVEKGLAERISRFESDAERQASNEQFAKQFKSAGVETAPFNVEEEEKFLTVKDQQLKSRQRFVETKEKELKEKEKEIENSEKMLRELKDILKNAVQDEEAKINTSAGHLKVALEAAQKFADIANNQKKAIIRHAKVIEQFADANQSEVEHTETSKAKDNSRLTDSFLQKVNNDDTIQQGFMNLSQDAVEDGFVNPLLQNTLQTPADQMMPTESSTPSGCRENLDEKLAKEEDAPEDAGVKGLI